MEKDIRFILMPSLKHIALVKIAITLWNQDDLRDSTSRHYFPLAINVRKNDWLNIENKVIKKITELRLPQLLENILLRFIRPVGQQIFEWIDYHVILCNFVMILREELLWTPLGTIDNKKTAEAIIKDESLSIDNRYKLACTYCLEDSIHVLLKQLPKDIYERELCFINQYNPNLVLFWSLYIEGKISQLDDIMEEFCQEDNVTPFEFAFRLSALDGNKSAVCYFLHKLSPARRDWILARTTQYIIKNRMPLPFTYAEDFSKYQYDNLIHFLLSQMRKEQKIDMFKVYGFRVLACFLRWPWQGFFMKMAKLMNEFLSKEDCYMLLRFINKKVLEKCKDFNYQELFGEFWLLISTASKKYVLHQCISSELLLSGLFEVEDKENIKFIFDEATATQKDKIIFKAAPYIFMNLLYDENWDMIQFFIQDCIASKDVIGRFKKKYQQLELDDEVNETFKEEKNMWSKFYQLMDDFIKKDDKKRSVEVGNKKKSPAKRFCGENLK